MLAGASMFFGAALCLTSALAGYWFWAAVGAAGLTAGGLYLASPAWRNTVIVDEHGLEVASGGERRFRLNWDDIDHVVASPTHKAAFIAGPTPRTSLLLPGRGARAPYRIQHQAQLYEYIVAHVDPARISEVDRLSPNRPRAKTLP